MGKELELSHREKYDFQIIDMKGEMTYDDAEKIQNYIESVISDKTVGVVLNLAEVPYVNSSALAVLISTSDNLAGRKLNAYLMNLSESVERLLEVTGVQKFFNIIDSEEVLSQRLRSKGLDSDLEP
jgi:anti-anti-sigma factor